MAVQHIIGAVVPDHHELGLWNCVFHDVISSKISFQLHIAIQSPDNGGLIHVADNVVNWSLFRCVLSCTVILSI